MSGLLGGGKVQQQSVENVAPVVGNLRLSTSAQGAPISIVIGTGRVSPNLAWYGSFIPWPVTSQTSSGGGGGKGGGGNGGTTTNTNWVYYTSIVQFLCEGPVAGIGLAWDLKNVIPFQYDGIPVNLAIALGGYAQTPWSYLTSNFPGQDLAYRGVAYLYGELSLGSAPDLPNLSFEVYGTNQFGLIGSAQVFTTTGGATLNCTGHGYATNQIVRVSSSGSLPSQLLTTQNYYVVNPGTNTFQLSTVPQNSVDTTASAGFIVGGITGGSGTLHVQAYVPDALASLCAYSLLTNQYWGAGFPTTSVGDLTAWSNYCTASGTFISPVWASQESASSILERLLALSYTALVFSEGVAKFVPYYDQSLTANGVTYTPVTTVRYALTDDHFQPNGSADPVEVNRLDPADAYNVFQVQYSDRLYDYNSQTAQLIDQAGVDLYGFRPANPLTLSEVTSASLAQWVCGLLNSRAQAVRNTYTFRLPPWAILLEPADYATLTETNTDNGLSGVAVRVTSMEEDDTGLLTLEGEDAPVGVASTSPYPSQSAGGYSGLYNVEIGSVVTPAFFMEPGGGLTAALELGVAVTGNAALYGGCQCWVSTDNTSFSWLGTQQGGGSRYGTITNNVSAAAGQVANVALVGNGGTIVSGAANDAATGATLINLAGSEFADFTTATLLSANHYALTLAVRGDQQTTPAAHTAGDQFVRVDQTIIRSGGLPANMVGVPLYFKFPTFNAYGGGLQNLSEAVVYTFTVPRPTAPALTSITLMGIAGGFNFQFTSPVDWYYAGTEIHASQTSGFTPSSATLLKRVPGAIPNGDNQGQITGLVPNMTYYVRLIPYDSFGAGTSSSETPVITSPSGYSPTQGEFSGSGYLTQLDTATVVGVSDGYVDQVYCPLTNLVYVAYTTDRTTNGALIAGVDMTTSSVKSLWDLGGAYAVIGRDSDGSLYTSSMVWLPNVSLLCAVAATGSASNHLKHLIFIDPNTGAVVYDIGTGNAYDQWFDGIVFNPNSGHLNGWVTDGTHFKFVDVDPTTNPPTATVTAMTGVANTVVGYPTWVSSTKQVYFANGGALYKIDPVTAAASSVLGSAVAPNTTYSVGYDRLFYCDGNDFKVLDPSTDTVTNTITLTSPWVLGFSPEINIVFIRDGSGPYTFDAISTITYRNVAQTTFPTTTDSPRAIVNPALRRLVRARRPSSSGSPVYFDQFAF